MMFTRIPRGLIIDPHSERLDRVLEVIRGLYPHLDSIEHQREYIPGMVWKDFDVIFLGEYSGLSQQLLRENPPETMPPVVYIYSDSMSRNTLARNLRKLHPETLIHAPRYSALLSLLHDEGEGDNFIGTY